jgi:hypothetical protein
VDTHVLEDDVRFVDREVAAHSLPRYFLEPLSISTMQFADRSITAEVRVLP